MKREIQLLVFDWAGTTIDYGCIAPLAVFENIFKSREIILTREEILKPMGMGKRDHIQTLLETENVSNQWRSRYGRDWTESDLDEMFGQFNEELLKALPDYCEPIDGVVETIATLREQGLIIGSTTGYTRAMMDIVEPVARGKGYAPDYLVTAEMTGGYGRPYPYMLFENMCHFGILSTDCVVKVGDTAADMKEGKNAGAWSVGIVEGSSAANLTRELAEQMPADEMAKHMLAAEKILKEAGADYVIRTIRELPGIIAKINERMAGK